MRLGDIKKGQTVYIFDWFNEDVVELQVQYIRHSFGNLYVNVNYPHPKTNLVIPKDYFNDEHQRVLTVGLDVYHLFPSKEDLKKHFGDVYDLQLHELGEADLNEDEYNEAVASIEELYDKVKEM